MLQNDELQTKQKQTLRSRNNNKHKAQKERPNALVKLRRKERSD
jgi:hypothetical protein